MFAKIVWATDGSHAADDALPYVKDLAARHDAAILVLHSEELLVGPGVHGAAMTPGEEEIHEKIQAQVEQLASEGYDATVRFVGGSSVVGAAHHIADAALEAGADVIVAGTRGHTPIGALLVGSVTQRLLHIAPCPLLIVPSHRHAGGATGAKETSAAVA